MTHRLVSPAKASPGDRIAVLSPAWAAPAHFPRIHEQALQRLEAITGLVPVEFPTTRADSSPQARADDLHAAFADPSIRAVIATIGGDDQITVIRYLDPDLVHDDPKPFLGYSDNTHLLNWLWVNGVRGFYGGSTQVHLGPGPAVDDIHRRSLRAALLTGESITLTEPGESEDVGVPWTDPRALTSYGSREPTESWSWHGPARTVTGRTWGGCVEVLDQVLAAARFPLPATAVGGGVLLLETSEELPAASAVGRIVRSMGERGLLEAVDAVLVARPPTSDHDHVPPAKARLAHREEQRDVVVSTIAAYNPGAVVVVGIPFGHTRPQWILPYGGNVTVDGVAQTVTADYA